MPINIPQRVKISQMQKRAVGFKTLISCTKYFGWTIFVFQLFQTKKLKIKPCLLRTSHLEAHESTK